MQQSLDRFGNRSGAAAAPTIHGADIQQKGENDGSEYIVDVGPRASPHMPPLPKLQRTRVAFSFAAS